MRKIKKNISGAVASVGASLRVATGPQVGLHQACVLRCRGAARVRCGGTEASNVARAPAVRCVGIARIQSPAQERTARVVLGTVLPPRRSSHAQQTRVRAEHQDATTSCRPFSRRSISVCSARAYAPEEALSLN